ncbi:MAG: hypothetical protein EBX40_03525 [Gammaproteobacteria bacterium]|nr:hypothetical protein [Gammaproteobacteria bacterium]
MKKEDIFEFDGQEEGGSNSADKGGSPSQPHPDFDELLKAEEVRMRKQSSLDAEGEEGDPFASHDNNTAHEGFANSNHAKTENHSAEEHYDFEDHAHDNEELKELEHALGEAQSEGMNFEDHFGHPGDDASDFTVDEEGLSDLGDAVKHSSNGASMQRPKEGFLTKLINSGIIFYVVILAIVFGGGYFIIKLFLGPHKTAPAAQPAESTMSSKYVGFKQTKDQTPVQAASLPPAVPQNLNQNTSVLSSGSNPTEPSLGSVQYQSASGGVTVLQVNQKDFAKLLSDFRSSLTDNNKNIQDEVNSLKPSIASVSDQVTQTNQTLDSKVGMIETQLTNLDKKFDTYNQHLVSINHSLSKTQQQLQLILAERAEDIHQYTLRAVVPGRAWLVDNQGQTITLMAGQELKDYGKVDEINTELGYVKMSSGYVFK